MTNLDLVIRQLERRPEIAGNPIAREWLEVIRRGDAEKGEEIARNLCGNSGLTVQQALDEARRYFGL